MSKKAQSISINTIIIAAIALAVLVVLFLIFTGRLGMFSKGVGETASCENSCKALGMVKGEDTNSDSCKSKPDRAYIPGAYTDLLSANAVCCCSKQ